MTIRRVAPQDFDPWYRMRIALWPDANTDEDRADMQAYFTDEPPVTFVAQTDDGELIGFLEAAIRPYADGCLTRNVGYIEGWYVLESHRQQGVGAALVQAAEAWARSQGCKEMASDCLLENETSLKAHLALGYEEKERLIHFAKILN